MLGAASPAPLPLSNDWSPSAIKSNSVAADGKEDIPAEIGWTSMMRRGSNALRTDRPGLYYAIYAEPTTKKILNQ
jgi:adenine-specific DNA-methyltransferase